MGNQETKTKYSNIDLIIVIRRIYDKTNRCELSARLEMIHYISEFAITKHLYDDLHISRELEWINIILDGPQDRLLL